MAGAPRTIATLSIGTTYPVLRSCGISPVLNDLRMISSPNSTAPYYDNLKRSVLKLCLPFICTPLTHVSNLSLQEVLFPSEIKIANVLPIFKNDDPELFINHRPVSFLCSLSKVFERIM